MKPTEDKSALRRALLFWQNRSPFESHVQAVHKQTACCTRQQTQTTNGMRPMANPLNDIRLRTAPRKRRFCGQIEADHPAVNKRPGAVPRVTEGQMSMTNSLSPSECVAFAHKIAVEPLGSVLSLYVHRVEELIV